jgi:hypothetical protein
VHRLLTSADDDRVPVGGGLLPAAVAALTLAAGAAAGVAAVVLALADATGAGRG